MSDAAKEIRKAYYDAISQTVTMYDAQAPADAIAPYAVLTSIDYNQVSVKSIRHVDATVSLSIYDEYTEDGGNAAIDDLTNTIIDLIAPIDSSNYLTPTGWKIVTTKLLSIFNDKADVEPLRVFRKVLRIQHTLTQIT